MPEAHQARASMTLRHEHEQKHMRFEKCIPFNARDIAHRQDLTLFRQRSVILLAVMWHNLPGWLARACKGCFSSSFSFYPEIFFCISSLTRLVQCSPPEELVLPKQFPRVRAPLIAALLSPVAWQVGRPDLFDSFSAGVLLLQMAGKPCLLSVHVMALPQV